MKSDWVEKPPHSGGFSTQTRTRGADLNGVEWFRELVEPWMRLEQRDLPWRRSRDPWEVLVAECMLQQTQVARVVPRWEAFLDRFPQVHDCARAPLSETIRMWEGLGYNRRAVQLHRCSVLVSQEFDGRFPSDLPALLRLPGVGPYTARAILAFAFERDAAVLDTNVARILSRCVVGRRLGLSEAQAVADSLVPTGRGWEWNQGMLDLGAMVCTKRAPRCDACPVRSCCAWRTDPGNPVDPAEGSAAVTTRQSRFQGSDRQLRGRLVDALRRGPVKVFELGRVSRCCEADRIEKVVRSLITDGLAVSTGEVLTLAP